MTLWRLFPKDTDHIIPVIFPYSKFQFIDKYSEVILVELKGVSYMIPIAKLTDNSCD